MRRGGRAKPKSSAASHPLLISSSGRPRVVPDIAGGTPDRPYRVLVDALETTPDPPLQIHLLSLEVLLRNVADRLEGYVLSVLGLRCREE